MGAPTHAGGPDFPLDGESGPYFRSTLHGAPSSLPEVPASGIFIWQGVGINTQSGWRSPQAGSPHKGRAAGSKKIAGLPDTNPARFGGLFHLENHNGKASLEEEWQAGLQVTEQRGRKPGFRMSEEHRDKIRNSNILRALIEHVEGDREMSASQVSAGLGLLRKVMPDLTSVSGSDDEPPVKMVVQWLTAAGQSES